MEINKEYLNNNNISGGVNEKRFIVLHHTAVVGDGNIKILGGLDKDVDEDKRVSCHYFVRCNGQTMQFVDDDKIARHAGKSERQGHTNLNTYSLGIEIESDGEVFTQAQKDTTKQLIRYLMEKYSIKADRVIRHKDIAPSRKIDVGDKFRSDEHATYKRFQESLLLQDSDILKKKEVKLYMDMGEIIKLRATSPETIRRIDELNKYFIDVLF